MKAVILLRGIPRIAAFAAIVGSCGAALLLLVTLVDVKTMIVANAAILAAGFTSVKIVLEDHEPGSADVLDSLTCNLCIGALVTIVLAVCSGLLR